MSLPRQRFSKPVTSRRYLALRHARETIRRLDERPCEPDDRNLPPGWKYLASFDVPGLLAGVHEISATQKISKVDPGEHGTPDKSVNSKKQEFLIVAPRFELPEDAVYSVFPENNHSATHDVLPHIVFNDHMLPWERPPRSNSGGKKLDDHSSNRVPWMACFGFTADELQLSPGEMSALFSGTSISTSAKQADSLGVSVPVADLTKVNGEWAKLPVTDDWQATKPTTNIIFPKASLINALFALYDDANRPLPSPEGGADISRHRFLAHSADINTTGMANADETEGKSIRRFSMLISNRTGPLRVSDGKPVQIFVHVVSLENMETSLTPFPLTVKKEGDKESRVGLISLHSWSYMCLPPDSFNVADAFDELAATCMMIKPNMPGYDPIKKGEDPIDHMNPLQARLIRRLRDGYTMIRSLTPTGEETAALMRGPLTPTTADKQITKLSSNSGGNLQTFDPKLGMMDLTFSLAWNLGRTLALADRAYTIALTRVRRQILQIATDDSRLNTVRATLRQNLRREELLRGIATLVGNVVDISKIPEVAEIDNVPTYRWSRSPCQTPELTYHAPGVRLYIDKAIQDAAYTVASSTDKEPDWWGLPYDPPYDEFNTPFSPDWVLVLRFVLDLYYLVNVPSRYMLVEQSSLPPESLRFFHVDQNWIDALIDGALSLGNQGLPKLRKDYHPSDEADDDPVRSAMKMAVNRYLTSPNSRKYRPPVPRFGFYLRSQVVAQFPDLKVSVSPVKNELAAPMLLRHDILDKGTILGFFSDEPIRQGVRQLVFEVPAHQQYFSIGSKLTDTELTIDYKRQYTVRGANDSQRDQAIASVQWKRDNGGKGVRKDKGKTSDTRIRSSIFIWGSEPGATDVRLLQVEKLAGDVFSTVFDEMKKIQPTWFTEKCATSAMMGFQLNSPAWRLEISNMEQLSEHMKIVGEVSPLLCFKEKTAPERDLSILPLPQVLPKIKSLPLPDVQQRSGLAGLQRTTLPPYAQKIFHVMEPEKTAIKAYGSAENGLIDEEDPSHESSSGATTPSSSWFVVDFPTVAAIDRSRSSAEYAIEELSLPPPYHHRRLVPSGPRFNYRISATTSPGVDNVPLLYTRQDLVFSIVYEARGKGFQMKNFVISIPVGSTGKNNLMDTAPRGVAVHMISNLRFHCRLSYSSSTNSLQISIIPRRVKDEGVDMTPWVGKYKDSKYTDPTAPPNYPVNPLAVRTELSVMLSGVRISKKLTAEVDVECTFQPFYVHSASDPETVLAKLRVHGEEDTLGKKPD